MDRLFFSLGSLLALVAVGLGAFGAHSLQGTLTPEMADVYETGVRYQFYHALALLGVAFAETRWSSTLIPIAGWLFVAGIVLFSGSLYVLSLSGIRALGIVTPIGGLAFLGGWLLLALGALQG